MKKLAVLVVLALSFTVVHGQEHKSNSCMYDRFFARDGVSVDLVTMNDPLKNGYLNRYHFNANGKNYILSYEGGQKIDSRLSYGRLYDGERVERKIYLYRQDDSVKNVWNIASNIIDVDYHERIADPDYAIDFYDVFFIFTDDEIGSYVKPLKNGSFEICIVKFRYESFKQADCDKHYDKYLLKPNKDQTYKASKL
jgi:hypothetical protein